MIELELTVIAIHGEGDRATVNSLAAYRNELEVKRYNMHGMSAPESLNGEPDEAADVTVVLRDEHHHTRLELPVTDWDEVEKWKELAGWDADKRHWKHGAKIQVILGD